MRRVLVAVVVAVAVGIAIAGAVFAALGPPVRVFTIDTDAMSPALPRGARVEVWAWPRRPYRPRRGDPVILPHAGAWLVKRVVGLPGERIEVIEGKTLLAGRMLEEPWRDLSRGGGRNISPTPIPSGRVFLLGDVRGIALDSRDFGSVPVSSLLGRAERIE